MVRYLVTLAHVGNVPVELVFTRLENSVAVGGFGIFIARRVGSRRRTING